jgi:hypothetical protein
MHINFATKRRINLDPKMLKEIKLTRLVVVSTAGVVIALMLLFGLVQKLRLDHISWKKSRIEAEVNKLRQNEPLQDLNFSNIGDKDKVFAKYDGRVMWSGILKDITNHITPGAWLSSVKSNESGTMLVISGLAVDQPSVAELVRSLQSIKSFRQVRLSSSKANEAGDKTKVVFNVDCFLAL